MALTEYGKLVADIANRKSDWRGSILPASRWLDTVKQCSGGGMCSVIDGLTAEQWSKAESDAKNSLTYSSEKMGVKDFKSATDSGLIARLKCIVTATELDRDGDLLESKGANPDPQAPFLWQHLPSSPIGKWLTLVEQNDDIVVAEMGIVAMKSDLAEDAARLAEAGCLRISHGFDPKKYKPLKGGKGWHVETFDILEVSLVSIPANKRAEILDFSYEKLKHPAVKAYYAEAYKRLPPMVNGATLEQKTEKPCSCKDKKASKASAMDECVSEKIRKLMNEGKEQDQAIAIAFSMCGEDKSLTPFGLKDHRPIGRIKSNGGSFIGCPYFPGSYEWITDELEDDAEEFLEEAGVSLSRYSCVSVMATFPDKAILCVYQNPFGGDMIGYYGPYDNDFDADDGYTFYEASWSGADDPEWSGEPKEVELAATTRAFLKTKEGKQFMATKTGRAVSAKNYKLIKEAHGHFEDIHQFDQSTQGHKALAKTAMSHLKDVMGGGGEAMDNEEKSGKVLSADKIKSIKAAHAIGHEIHDMDGHNMIKTAAHMATIKLDAVLAKGENNADMSGKENPGVDGKENPGMTGTTPKDTVATMPMDNLALKTLARIKSGERVPGSILLSLKETVDEAVDQSIEALAASF